MALMSKGASKLFIFWLFTCIIYYIGCIFGCRTKLSLMLASVWQLHQNTDVEICQRILIPFNCVLVPATITLCSF